MSTSAIARFLLSPCQWIGVVFMVNITGPAWLNFGR
jgi:hypothetical protein